VPTASRRGKDRSFKSFFQRHVARFWHAEPGGIFVLTAITDLGDSSLLLPASALLAAYLWTNGPRHAARAWLVTVTACLAATAALKIGFHACGAAVPELDMRSPSGHSAFSATFYGCGAILLARARPIAARLAIIIAGAALIVAIAISRTLLQAHTDAEVLVGLLVGGACTAYFRWASGEAASFGRRGRHALGVLVLLAAMTHGQHLNAEEAISGIAVRLRLATQLCQ
jgi:membrane-associated phospholipid phosphatase